MNGVTVEDTLKAVTNAFQEKNLEIQRQKEMINELVKRLRERGRLDTRANDEGAQEKEEHSLALLAGLHEKISYDYMLGEISRETRKNTVGIVDVTTGKSSASSGAGGAAERKRLFPTDDPADGGDDLPLTPELRRAIAKLSTQYEQALGQIILSVQQDAQSRKGLADDNSWLWMQTTQLKKQLEDAFDQGKVKTASSPTTSTDSKTPKDDGCTIS